MGYLGYEGEVIETSAAKLSRLRSIVIALVAIVAMLIVGVASADATTRSVMIGGTDSGDCSDSPCATIQYAINQAAATGDDISVGAGTFHGSFTITNKALRIHGDGSNTILTAPTSPVANLGAGSSDSEFEDLKFLGLGTIPTSTASAIRTDVATSGVKIANVEVTNFGSFAIAIHNNAVANGWVIDGLNSHDNQHGMRVRGAASNLTITNSHFDDNVSHGFFAVEAGPVFDNVTITNTTFNGNGDKAFYLERGTNISLDNVEANSTGGGVHPSPHAIEFNLKNGATAGPVAVTNSEVIGSTGPGIVVRGGASSPTVSGATITGNTVSGTTIGIGFQSEVDLGNVIVEDNLLSENDFAITNTVPSQTLVVGFNNEYNDNGSDTGGLVGSTVSLVIAGDQVNPTNDSAIEFELTADRDLNSESVQTSDFQVTNGTVDSVSGTGSTYSIFVTAADQGDVELSRSGTFEVEDLVGNTQTVLSSTPTVHYDTAPELTLEQANSQVDPTNNASIDFTLSGNEALDGASIDASDFDVTNGSVAGITGSNDEFNVEVTADADGDVSIVPSNTFEVDDNNPGFAATSANGIDRTVTYDTTAPDTSIDQKPTDPSYDPTPTFDLGPNEPGLTFECRLWEDSDSVPAFDQCADPYNSAFLAEGNYNFEVRAVDAAGNTGDTESYVWARQQSALSGGPEEPLYFTDGDTPVEFRMLAEDDQPGSFSYEFINALGGGTVDAFSPNGTATYTPGDGFAGQDTLNVRVINDSTGGETEAEVLVQVRPVSNLTGGPGVSTTQLTNDNTPTFSYNAVAGPNNGVVTGATFVCRIDGSAMSNTACNTGSITTASLSEGEHTFTVRAAKPLAIQDPTPASVTFTVDTIAPDAPTNLQGPSGLTNINDASYTFDIPEGSAECRLISIPVPDPSFEDCDSPVEFADLADTSYLFEVRTRDNAGNVSASVDLGTPLTVDTVVDVSIDSAPADGNTDARPEIAFSSTEDPDVTYECRLYEAAIAPEEVPAYEACTSPEQLSLLDKNFNYAFDVRVTDEAGNTAEDHVEWLQSNTAPAVVEPDVTLEAGTSAPVNLGGSDSDLGDEVTYSITTPPSGGGSLGTIDQDTGLVDFHADADATGVYTFEYQVTDGRAGGTVTGTATIRIQPDTVILTSPDPETNDQTPTWTFDSPADLVDTFECSLDGGAWEDCSSGTYTPASDLAEDIDPYSFEVRAVDGVLEDPTPAEDTVIIDLTAPGVDITITPDTLSNDANPAIEFESDDGTAVFECAVDDDPFETCVSGDTFGPLEDGDHTFTVRAIDPATNVSTDSYDWEADLTEPEVSLGGQPVGVKNGPGEGKQTNARRPFWHFERSDLNLVEATVRCRIDLRAWEPCEFSPFQPLANLSDGQHTLRIEADDEAGNTGSLEIQFRVNTVGPSVTLTTTPDSPSGPTAAFAFSANADLGAEGGFQCRTTFNSGTPSPWETCASPLTLSNLTSGSRTLQVRAVDSAGNESIGGQIASHSWTTIGGVPDTEITGTSKSGSSATFGFRSPGNPLATFACSIDGGAFESCTSPKTYSGLSFAAHTFRVRASNAAGTTDATPAVHEWTASAIGLPATSITKRPAASTTSKSASFEFSADLAVTGYECSLDSAAFAACTSPKALSDLAVGAHNFRVRAVSSQGTGGAASYDWTIVAPEAPVVVFSKKPAASTTAKSASFEFNSASVVTGFECSLDDADFAACTSPVNLTGLAVGAHTFKVKAIGEQATAGAVESHSWTVTAPVAPDASITKSPPANTTSKTADFEFTSSSAAAGFECRLDGEDFVSCTSPKSYSGLAVGAHAFQVRAIGEQSSVGTAASFNWTVLAEQAPETNITRQPAASTASPDATFEFTSSQAGSTFECRLDGAAWETCESPKALTGLSVASHTFDVRAKGASGLTDASPSTVSWQITESTVDPPVCNPIGEKAVVTGSAKLNKKLLASVRISHRSARPGQVILVNLKGGAKKKKAFSKVLKRVDVVSGGKVIAKLRGKSWSSSFTVKESQANNLTLRFIRKKGKAIKKPAPFTVQPACDQ